MLEGQEILTGPPFSPAGPGGPWGPLRPVKPMGPPGPAAPLSPGDPCHPREVAVQVMTENISGGEEMFAQGRFSWKNWQIYRRSQRNESLQRAFGAKINII